MKITDVKITKYERNNVKGFANVTLDDAIVITGISIIDGKNGLFISMPNAKGKDNNYHDIVFPIKADARKALTDAVVDAFKKEV